VSSLNFRHFSRENWSLLKKLECNQSIKLDMTLISPNQVANHIVNVSRIPPNKSHTIRIKKRYKIPKENCTQTSELFASYIEAEISETLKDLKREKAAKPDGTLLKFLIN